jgi:hypothetical protein
VKCFSVKMARHRKTMKNINILQVFFVQNTWNGVSNRTRHAPWPFLPLPPPGCRLRIFGYRTTLIEEGIRRWASGDTLPSRRPPPARNVPVSSREVGEMHGYPVHLPAQLFNSPFMRDRVGGTEMQWISCSSEADTSSRGPSSEPMGRRAL